MLAIMKILWLVLSTLFLHQAVAMRMVREPAKEMSEIAQVAVSEKVEQVLCPGGQYVCPDGNTCCKLASGEWGCCPLPEAVCCSDAEHCCPNGYTCTGAGQCRRGSQVIEPFKKTPAIQVQLVICPDGQTLCLDDDTCCKLASGRWGCCPLPNAVCCSDGKHCCPQNTTCDLTTGKCLPKNLMVDLSKIQPVSKVEQVVCPGEQYACSDGNTCCKLASGEWGCCPLPNAVCCSDGEHCCPNGYTCTGTGQCQSGSHVTELFKKMPAVQVQSVVCPGGKFECPDGSTCCKLSSGQWGCCPLPDAVCCSDGEHCCPNGYTCSSGECQRGSHVIKLFTKTHAIQVQQVVCPGGQSVCPDGETCCELASGEWGCCPLPKAVCCSDGEHCCPHGTTCDVSEGKCVSGLVADLSTIQPALKHKKAVEVK